MNFLVNVGLYLFKPEIINLVAKNKFLEMDVLIKKVKQKGGKIGIFLLVRIIGEILANFNFFY